MKSCHFSQSFRGLKLLIACLLLVALFVIAGCTKPSSNTQANSSGITSDESFFVGAWTTTISGGSTAHVETFGSDLKCSVYDEYGVESDILDYTYADGIMTRVSETSGETQVLTITIDGNTFSAYVNEGADQGRTLYYKLYFKP